MNRIEVKYAVWSPTKGWFRGARFWRWTRFRCFAAWHTSDSTFKAFRYPNDAELIVETTEFLVLKNIVVP